MITLTIFICYLLINLITYILFFRDKKKAERNEWRIPEKTLLLFSLFGGGLGAGIGMRRNHHKTKKLRFRFLIPLLAGIQVTVFVFLIVLGIYDLDPYQPNERALSYSYEDVTVKEHLFYISYDGTGEEKALIFYPGGKVAAKAYAPLMQEISHSGIDCYLLKVPYNLAILGIPEASFVASRYNYDAYYLGGHSLGGVAASALLSGHEEDYEGIVLLASYANKEISSPALLIRGSEDGVLNREAYSKALENIRGPYEEHILEGGNHAGFADYGPQKGDHEAGITNEEQQSQTAGYILEWIR